MYIVLMWHLNLLRVHLRLLFKYLVGQVSISLLFSTKFIILIFTPFFFFFFFFFITGIVISIFSLAPFLTDELARVFPFYLPLCVVIPSNCFAFILTWAYTNGFKPNSFTCDQFSTTCLTQCFFNAFFTCVILIYGIWLAYRIALSCLSLEFPFIRKHLPTLNNCVAHKVIVHSTSLCISFIIALITIMFAQDETSYGPSVAPGAFCVPSVTDRRQFYSYYIPITILCTLLLFLILISLIQFARTNIAFLIFQIRATLFSFVVLFFIAVILTTLYLNFNNNLRENYYRAYECAVLHPREQHPQCEKDTEFSQSFNINFFTFSVVVYTIFPAFESFFISLTHPEVWQWWADVLRGRPYVPISARLNPFISHTSRTNTTQVKNIPQPHLDRSTPNLERQNMSVSLVS
jgi:hypothetical protein